MKVSNTSKRLKELMSEQNLKQVDILEKAKPFCSQFDVKLTKVDLSQYVSGKVEPGQFKLLVLSRALGVNELWLMGFDVPRDRSHIINVPHQDFDQDALVAVQILASYCGYDFNIFANQYQLNNKNFTIKLSAKEVEDYVNASIHQIQTVTDAIVQNKLNDNIVSINQDRFVLNAAHERTDIKVTDEMHQHDNNIMNDDSEWE